MFYSFFQPGWSLSLSSSCWPASAPPWWWNHLWYEELWAHRFISSLRNFAESSTIPFYVKHVSFKYTFFGRFLPIWCYIASKKLRVHREQANLFLSIALNASSLRIGSFMNCSTLTFPLLVCGSSAQILVTWSYIWNTLFRSRQTSSLVQSTWFCIFRTL